MEQPAYIISGTEHNVEHAYLSGYVLEYVEPGDDEDEKHRRQIPIIIAVSFVGSKTSVHAICARLKKGEPVDLQVPSGDRYRALCGPTPSRYAWLTTTLPSGFVNALVLHPLATLQGAVTVKPDRCVYLVEPVYSNEDHLLTHFVSILDAATPIPLMRHWGRYLMMEGTAAGLVCPVNSSYRMHAYRVCVDHEKWVGIIRYGIRNGYLREERSDA